MFVCPEEGGPEEGRYVENCVRPNAVSTDMMLESWEKSK